MALIVQKFGGTSIANVDRIKSVATRVLAEINQGNQVIVVVSAMAGVTNQLVGWAHQCVNHHLTAAEYDVVISSGEQVTCGLMALALNDLGIPARSWLGWQIPLQTNDHFKNATILDFAGETILHSITAGEVAVVAGFQGISSSGRLTTLGRGGSDYTALALAAELKAERCDIYTDVDGVFTADPRIVTNARQIKNIAFKDLLDLAQHGSKVVQPQALEAVKNNHINIRVLSSFNDKEGSVIQSDLAPSENIIGVASRRDRSMFTLTVTSRELGLSSDLQKYLYDNFIDVDETCSFVPDGDSLMILVARDDFEEAEALVNQFVKTHPTVFGKITTQSRVARVALVGNISKYSKNLLNKIQPLFELKEIEIYQMQFNSRALSLVLPPDRMEEAVKILHDTFVLNQMKIMDVHYG